MIRNGRPGVGGRLPIGFAPVAVRQQTQSPAMARSPLR